MYRMLCDYAQNIIITTGVFTECKYEVVRQELERLDVSWIGKIHQQPGGPQGYGVYGETPIIALPGNPISTLVSLRMLVLPALWTAFAAGDEPTAIQVKIHDAGTGIRHKTQYRRAVVGTQGFELVATIKGQADWHVWAEADG